MTQTQTEGGLTKDFKDVVQKMRTTISCPQYRDNNSYFGAFTELTFDEVEQYLRRIYDIVDKKLGEEKLRRVLRLLGGWWECDFFAVQAYSRDVVYDPYEHDSDIVETPRSPPLKLYMRCGVGKCYELQLRGGVVARKYKVDCDELKRYGTEPPGGTGTFYKLVKYNIKETFANAIVEYLFGDEETWKAVKKIARVVPCLPRSSPVLELIAHLREILRLYAF